MTRDVTDEDLGRLSRQWADLFERIRKGSVEVEHAAHGLQLIKEHKLPASTNNTYTLTINYSQLVSEALKAGNYDWVSSDITDINFHTPSLCSCCGNAPDTETVKFYLIHFNKVMTTEQVKSELDKQGLRPANIQELLAFGIQNPDVQRKFPIIALGSECVVRRGLRRVPSLDGSSSVRKASLHWVGDGWYSRYRVLAISK